MNVTERVQTRRAAVQESYCSEALRRSATERVLHAVNADKLLQTTAYTCALIVLLGVLGQVVFAFHGKPFPTDVTEIMKAAFYGLLGLLTAASVKSQEGRKPPGR